MFFNKPSMNFFEESPVSHACFDSYLASHPLDMLCLLNAENRKNRSEK